VFFVALKIMSAMSQPGRRGVKFKRNPFSWENIRAEIFGGNLGGKSWGIFLKDYPLLNPGNRNMYSVILSVI
jgi:hypothetical protein